MDVTLGEWIKAVRADLGISQVEMSKLLGRSPMTISRWERDLSVPDSFFLRIIDLFRVAAQKDEHSGYYALTALAQEGPVHALYSLLDRALSPQEEEGAK